MFSPRKPPDRGPGKPESATPQRPARGDHAPSILSAGLEVMGDLATDGDMHVDGVVHGNVRAAAIVVGDAATIMGDIVADDVTVYGRVIGHLYARRAKLCAKAHVEGDIQHETLTVEHGAFFDGNCRHSADPTGGAKTAPKLPSGGRTNGWTALPAAETADTPPPTTILGDLSSRRRP